MCYFITIGTTQEQAGTLRRQLADTFGTSPVSNDSILKLLPVDYQTFNLAGMCSCHLYSESRREPLNTDHLRGKYRKKGWSESKIERAISGKLSAQKESFKGLRPDLRERLCSIATEIKRLFIIVHFYSGAVDSEEIPVEGKKVVQCDDLLLDESAIPEDTLVEVVA